MTDEAPRVLLAATRTRRGFLRLAAGGVAAALLGCQSVARGAVLPEVTKRSAAASAPRLQEVVAPTATPRPVPAEGRYARPMLPGTPWETPLYLNHSGRQGATVLVLGGVHGNEPGGWLAAEEVAGWMPTFGSLLVIPRANLLATRMMERTTAELGDLNRLYPGAPDAPAPMARMAFAILEVAREFGATVLLDMHESWAFYAERAQNGTAFLGQTIGAGRGPEGDTLARHLADRANVEVGVRRDLFWTRDQLPLPGAVQPPPSSGAPRPAGISRSSLGAGEYVAGLTPVLVEMGQMDQSISRRVDLHVLVARVLLQSRGMI